jgi:uncharacterized protein
MPFPLWLLVGLSLLFGGAATGALPPKPDTYVADEAHILTRQTIAELNSRLDTYERESSNQILVATFPSVPTDYALEDFTQRTAEAWGAGQKEQDNGAVLFIFPNDRRMRIEVGYGLEGVLPDATAKQIIEYEIRPAFAAGSFDAGVTRGVDAMIKATRGEYKGTGRTDADRGDSGGPTWIVLLIIIIVLILIIRKAGGGGGTTFGGRGGRSVWIPPIIGGGGSGGGFSGGGGGGFSGGGGSFGGGGASGGW